MVLKHKRQEWKQVHSSGDWYFISYRLWSSSLKVDWSQENVLLLQKKTGPRPTAMILFEWSFAFLVSVCWLSIVTCWKMLLLERTGMALWTSWNLLSLDLLVWNVLHLVLLPLYPLQKGLVGKSFAALLYINTERYRNQCFHTPQNVVDCWNKSSSDALLRILRAMRWQ